MTLNLNALGLAAMAAIFAAAALLVPQTVDLFVLLRITVFIVMCILALSLALIWGYGGILCFGQSAFFGLGAYTYAIAMINLGESTTPFLLSILVPGLFAAALGYFLFYGRLGDVYLAVITLCVTLILFNFLNSTAGDAYRIGAAKLGGFNGISAIPPLNMPGDPKWVFGPQAMYYVSLALLAITYFGLRILLASRFGRIVVAIRENETRAELTGYDIRLYKLIVFSIGGGIAGLAGCLFANWSGFVSPNVFSLAQTAQILLWVIVGGLGTLIGPIVGCLAMQYLATMLGTSQVLNASLVFGAFLMAFVLLVPSGLVPTTSRQLKALGGWWRSRRARGTPTDAVRDEQ